ncbi:MAG TPA: glycosyltransferase family 2 protein [Pyrinomonadaceae bacterium]|jgi:dolichol-phosphate mannosyltransferase|nr:glycosyltransferase family 2 protein [Pyrinomonadaceae bacterium]
MRDETEQSTPEHNVSKQSTGELNSLIPHPSSLILSVVVPCYNEEDVIAETHRRLVGVLEGIGDGARFEIIYVDDGSRDRTAHVLHEIQRGDERVRVLLLSRNFGHQIAVTAGLEHARGDAVVLIDADLQDPPEVIPEMLAAWRAGSHVAYGVRTDRAGETRFKLWTAKLFYRLMNRLSGVEIPLDTGDFRLMDRRVVASLLSMPERDRFLRGMVSWVGFRQTPVHYKRAPRFAGASKYPFFKMLRFATDGVLSFSFTPLRLAIWMGFVAILFAFGGILYAVLLRFFFDPSHWVRGWASLFVAILFMGGVQLLSLGIIGEYIGRIYGEVKQRPLYFVRERLGFEKDDER